MLTVVDKTIKRYNLLQKNDKVLIAVSGGVDSLALLSCLYSLKEKYNLTLFVAHLNHMFRREEADRDAEYVQQISEKLGIEAIIEKVNVPDFLAKNSLSPQEGARIVRYNFLKSTAQKLGCNKIALGHHKDDQAETVLLNLIKGAGLDGLKGITPQRKMYIRPLIGISKAELESYCKSNNLSFCIDASNFKDIYLRNKIRNNLLPLLAKDYNPAIVDTLANTAEILNEENKYMQDIARRLELDSRLYLDQKKGEWSTKEFYNLPIALQRRLVRNFFNLITKSNYNLSFFHVEAVRNLILDNISGRIAELPGQMVAVYYYSKLKISLKEEYYRQRNKDFFYEITIPNSVFIKEIGALLEVKRLNRSDIQQVLDVKDRNEVLINIDPMDTLIIRNRQKGDRIRPVGMAGTKKIKDIFIDEKVERQERDRIPVILSKETGKIIWIAGLKSSEEFKNNSVKNAFLLKISQTKKEMC